MHQYLADDLTDDNQNYISRLAVESHKLCPFGDLFTFHIHGNSISILRELKTLPYQSYNIQCTTHSITLALGMRKMLYQVINSISLVSYNSITRLAPMIRTCWI